MSAGAAFGAIVRSGLAHYEANRPGVLAHSDPEYLHQVRVALRRLRSALNIFAPLLEDDARRALRKRLRRLLRRLGPARDWDVFLEFTLSAARDDATLLRQAGEKRLQARERARRALGSRTALALARELSGALACLPRGTLSRRSAREYAREALDDCDRRVRRRGRHLGRLDARGLHKLRLAVKRLRYAAHFFAPLFAGAGARPMRKALQAMQGALGGANDCAVAGELLDQLEGKGRAAVARRNRRKLAGHRRELRAAWRALRTANRYWQ